MDWLVLFVLFLGQLWFSMYVFPKYQDQIDEIAGRPLKALDTRFHYNHSEVLTLFDQMGEKGRAVNQFISGRLDMIYPLVYGGFLTLLLLKLRRWQRASRWQFVVFLPVIAVCFDYLENFGVLSLISKFPAINEAQVQYVATMTSLKWIFVGLSILAILITLVIRTWKKMSRIDKIA